MFLRALPLLFLAIAAPAGIAWHLLLTEPLLTGSVVALLLAALPFVAQRRPPTDPELPCGDAPLSLSPAQYEALVAARLRAAGWRARACGSRGDQGCDVLAERRGVRLVVQCKRLSGACGNAAVQQVVAARRHYGAHAMAVVCPAGFTRSARELAASNEVHLLHHDALDRLDGLAR